MSKQLLRNPEIKPTDEVIAEGLGTANSAFVNFISNLKNHDIDLEWRFYTDGNSWLGKGLYKWTGVRGGKKEVTVFWLSIWEGYFKVTVYVPEKVRTDAQNLPLVDEIVNMVKEAKQIGKLKFFPLIFDLCSEELFDEIFKLIDFRKLIKYKSP